MISKVKNTQVKYGLPQEVKFCKKCVISNQRPNSAIEFAHTSDTRKATINFDAEGVCDACRFAKIKKTQIDWAERERQLAALCGRYRKNNGEYDCIVPGSGGKDSFYAAHILKYKYGMHPLTVTWAPHLYTDWGWKNFQAWIHAGFDNYLHTPNGNVHRLLTRLALEKLFHPFQPFILGQKSLPPKLAVSFNIPLVFYGENEAEYGNPIADMSTAKRDRSYFTAKDQSKIYLGGVSVADLKQRYDISDNDLQQYFPADPARMEKIALEVHYLGYYLKWHPQSCYYYAVEHGGFQAAPERSPGTYGKYTSIDDKMDDLNFYTMFIKFGIGRATWDAAQEIRSGDITRDEGVSLVRRFDGEYPARFEDELFQYLSITKKDFSPKIVKMFDYPAMNKKYFMKLADEFRSPHLWERLPNEEWRLKRQVS
ncbi:MAG: N-acetyl sugar amidotransferase [Candidatus Giovannonibacteria bacterium]|nr:MAG: N-acetyl sugar amidotransferase [Candidatus Giovannonibacteria bacterium]